MRPLRLFYSRDQTGSFFSNLIQKDIVSIEAKSCIHLEVNRNDMPPVTDWIFFTSPSGFELFMHHFGLNRNVRLAALGGGTADKMKKFGLDPDYVPSTGDPQVAIETFCAQLNERETVLIPRSHISLQRFHSILPAVQMLDWPFYTNEPNSPAESSDADYLIFTSPSNAKAYLDAHNMNENQTAVAIGESTLKMLSEYTKRVLKSIKPTEEGIWEVIQSHISAKAT